MAPLIVLISGANRGLAANHNPENTTSKGLADLPTGPCSRLIVVKANASVTFGSVLQNQLPIPNAAYTTSKVAVHWRTKRTNAEEDKLTAFVISPGLCQTDLGNTGVQADVMEKAPVKAEDSCRQMVQLIEGATKESHGGKLWNYEGDQMTW